MVWRARPIGAGLATLLALMAVAGPAQADVGATSGVSVTGNGLTVSATGSWFWPDPTTSRDTKYVGYAIDWGDVASGNTLGSYHLGDGTATTNVVLQPTTPDRGSSGSFGPVSHTYSAPGTYTVCAIVYDLGSVQPIRATGWHSLRASGTDRNKDNSVDQQGAAPPVSCATIDVTSATSSGSPAVSASPGQSVGGATFGPGGSTPPPTVTDASMPLAGGSGMAFALGLLLVTAGGAMLALSIRKGRT